MLNKIKSFAKEILVFVVTLIIISNAISYYKSSDLKKDSLDIKSLTLIDGSTYNIPKNKAILVHFWGTWCPVCKLEASNIDAISKSYEVITIAVDSKDNENIKKYLEDNNVNFKVHNDTQSKIANSYNIAVYPTSFIYDKNGKLIFTEVGYTSTLGLKLRMWWANL
jgi:thiol-disulfide isomerase/thioredoxin